MLKAFMPLARTPMDEKGARSLNDYEKRLEKALYSQTPWDKKVRAGHLSDLRKKIKSGTIVVIPDASDNPNSPLYKDATILKG